MLIQWNIYVICTTTPDCEWLRQAVPNLIKVLILLKDVFKQFGHDPNFALSLYYSRPAALMFPSADELLKQYLT